METENATNAANATGEARSEGEAPSSPAQDKPVTAERAAEVEPKPAAPPQPGVGPRKAQVAAQIDDLFAAVRRLESFAADEAKRVSGKLVPNVEEHAKKNIWFSLLLALGLGLILGIWLTGGRRRE